jgi:hypothetical protein
MMNNRHNGEHRYEDRFERDRRERARFFQERGGQRVDERDDDHAAAPGREWEHERSSGIRSTGEAAYSRSPRQSEPERYGYGSGGRWPEDDQRNRPGAVRERFGESRSRQFGGRMERHDYDDRHNWQDSPSEFGERSYGGYGDWPGPEYEGLRIGREGYDEYSDDRNDPRSSEVARRSGAARWGLGRSGSGSARGGSRFGLSEEAQAGRFAGRGPKGYRRSDERILEEVNEALTAAPHVDASSISVDVKEGEVTLEGIVESRTMKRDAEDLAAEVSGVQQVHNRLRIETADATSSGNR